MGDHTSKKTLKKGKVYPEKKFFSKIFWGKVYQGVAQKIFSFQKSFFFWKKTKSGKKFFFLGVAHETMEQ